VIREGCAQIVCLQEVEVNATNHGVDSPLPMQTRIWSSLHEDDQPSVIASLAGYQYHAFAPAIRSRASSRWKETHDFVSAMDVSGNFGVEQQNKECTAGCKEQNINDMGKFGIAILSKYPIIQIRTHQYQRYKRKTLRNAMACLISLPNNTLLWVVNTHLGCHFIGKEQHDQSKELVAFVESLERKPKICGVILCGDFNSPPIFPCIRSIGQSGLRDVWRLCAGKDQRAGGTFPSNARVLGMPCCFRKLLRLDYIFLHKSGRDVVCKCVYVCDDSSLASDHLPLCAVFFVGN